MLIIGCVYGTLHPPFLAKTAIDHTLKQFHGPFSVFRTVADQVVINKSDVLTFYFFQLVQNIFGSSLTILFTQISGYRTEIAVKRAAARGLDRVPKITWVQQIVPGG